jgi:tRNA A37 methylthiotransferase MiaB
MKKHILMVYPEIPNTYWGFQYAVGFMNKKAAIIPLGLLTVAALLPRDYQVKLVDMNVTPLEPEDIEKADMVFISAMIVQKQSFKEVVELCNRLAKPVVAGGPYPISLYKEIEGVDHFVLDEAELTLPVFLDDLEKGVPKKVYRDERKPDIALTPVPRFDLIDVSQYHSMALQYSRGCPYQCEFCDIIEMFGRVSRTKVPEQFIRELDAVYQTGFRGAIFVVDDNFVGNHKKVKALLRAIVSWQESKSYPFSFNTEASIDLAQDDELLDLMVEAGFNSVFIGVETPDDASLQAIKKTQNLKIDVASGIKKIQRSGMEVTGGFIVGFDTDTEDIFDRQIAFIQEVAMPLAMVGLLMVGPNTQLYRRLRKEGRWVSEPSGNNTHHLHLNFETLIPQEVIIDGYKRVLSEIYSPPRYFERCINLLKRLPAKVKHARPLQWEHVRALFLSLTRQTASFYGFHYLWYLLRAIVFNIRSFPAAVSMAVMGHHFFLITKEILRADEFTLILKETKEELRLRCADVSEQFRDPESAHVRPHLVHDVLSFVHSAHRTLQKQYRSLNAGVQQYLSDTFAEFQGFYEMIVAELRRIAVDAEPV